MNRISYSLESGTDKDTALMGMLSEHIRRRFHVLRDSVSPEEIIESLSERFPHAVEQLKNIRSLPEIAPHPDYKNYEYGEGRRYHDFILKQVTGKEPLERAKIIYVVPGKDRPFMHEEFVDVFGRFYPITDFSWVLTDGLLGNIGTELCKAVVGPECILVRSERESGEQDYLSLPIWSIMKYDKNA